MESRRAALVVVALVLLSGCSGSGLGPSATPTTETRTTAPATAVPTESATATTAPRAGTPTEPASAATTTPGETLPPGVNRSGVEDAAALVAAHQRGLNNTSFAFRFRANVSVGPASQWTYQRGAVEEGLSPLVVRSASLRQLDGEATRVATDLWANGTTVVARYQRANRTELRRYNRTGGNLADETWAHLPRADLDSQVTQAWLLELALSAGEYDLARVERRDGRRFAVLRATEAVAAANFTDLNATVVADSAGRVHSLSLTAAYAGDDENRIRYEFELTEVGSVAVERPQWVGATIPPNQTANDTTTTVPAESGTTTIPAERTTTPEADTATTSD